LPQLLVEARSWEQQEPRNPKLQPDSSVGAAGLTPGEEQPRMGRMDDATVGIHWQPSQKQPDDETHKRHSCSRQQLHCEHHSSAQH
jgi:hypothetical protein